MNTRETKSFADTKKNLCDICEKTFSKFNGDFITVPDKTCDEVRDIINYAKSGSKLLHDIDISKYIYVVETNGTTFIKK